MLTHSIREQREGKDLLVHGAFGVHGEHSVSASISAFSCTQSSLLPCATDIWYVVAATVVMYCFEVVVNPYCGGGGGEECESGGGGGGGVE